MPVLRRYAPAALLLAALLLLWEVACRLAGVPVFIVPAPSRITLALWEWREPLVRTHLPVTLTEALLGLTISIGLGALLAGAMHLSPGLDRALGPLVVATQTIPLIALSPVFLFWFGYSLAQKVAVVVLITFFPLAISTRDGLRNADPEMINLLRSIGASRWRILAAVEVPAALPAFFSGLKVAAPVSVIGAVLGEWLGGQNGLGVFGRRAASNLKSPELFASVVVLALLGITLYLLAALGERMALPYRRAAGSSPTEN